MRNTRNRTLAVPARQRGQAIIALLLVFVAGTSFLLLRDINNNIRQANRAQETARALAGAKQALIAYAARYPFSSNSPTPEEGPGYLPCPDRSTNTNTAGRAANDCSTAGGTLIGRVPWRTLDLDSARDATGEILWYALSQNYRYGAHKRAPLNSETRGQLAVDGSDDVVAVLLAPGFPTSAQSSRSNDPTSPGYLLASEYLDEENADGDTVYASRGTGAFNDQIEFITRRELMAAVEARAINEVARALDDYRSEYGAYPWLTPFVDPKVAAPVVAGSAMAGSGPETLVAPNVGPNAVDFTRRGVSSGDIVYNITDGSFARVDSVAGSALNISDSLRGGTDNEFAVNDSFLVLPSGADVATSGTASAGTANDTLVDSAAHFTNSGITIGQVVENLTKATAYTIEDVSATSLSVRRVAALPADLFETGDSYRIRTSIGSVTSGAGSQLTDDEAEFDAIGLSGGEVVENLTTGAVGVVATVGSATTLGVTTVLNGSALGSSDDSYRISRNVGVDGQTNGLLPVQSIGDYVATGFTFQWSTTVSNGAVYTETGGSSAPSYSAFLRRSAESSATSGPLSFESSVAVCRWLDETIANCIGSLTPAQNILSGTASAGSGGGLLVDGSKGDFALEWGVEAGDLLRNESDGSVGIITAVSGSSVSAVKFTGGISNAISVNDSYRIEIATSRVAVTLEPEVSPGIWSYSGPNLAASGMTTPSVVTNETAGGSVADVTAIPSSFNWITVANIEGGSRPDFLPGDVITFRSKFAAQRRYEVNVRFRGSARTYADNGQKLRDVCLGYGSTPGSECQSSGADVSLPESPNATNDPTPMIRITDYDWTGVSVGGADLHLPHTPAPAQGRLLISGMRDSLTVELPPWFTRNRWHELVYVAYAAGFAPGEAGLCSLGVSCLTICPVEAEADCPSLIAAGNPMNNKAAVVVAASMPLDVQDRAGGAPDDYYEGNNANGDLTYSISRMPRTDADPLVLFNDRLRVIDTFP